MMGSLWIVLTLRAIESLDISSWRISMGVDGSLITGKKRDKLYLGIQIKLKQPRSGNSETL